MFQFAGNMISRLLLLVFAPCVLSAQYEQILNDADVIWAAEFDITYNLLPSDNSDSIEQNEIVFWKNYAPESLFPHRNGELLMEKILAAACSGDWPAWQFDGPDRLLSRQETSFSLSEELICVTFDVVTLKDTVVTSRNLIDPASFVGIRAKQLIYFDNKKGEFGLYTSSIAPVRYKFGYYNPKPNEWMGVHDSEYVPFWLKMPAFSKKVDKRKPDPNDPKILWAAQIKTRDNSPEVQNIQVLKDTRTPVMQVLLDRFRFDSRYAVLNTSGEPIPFESRDQMLFSTDTVVTYDRETGKAELIISNKTITADTVSSLRLVEDWFWDDRQKRLTIRLSGFAPILTQYHLGGHFQVETPLFYRRKK